MTSGPARPVTAAVVGHQTVGAFRLVRLALPADALGTPGQFFMARDALDDAPLARPVGLFALGPREAGLLVDPARGVGRLAAAERLELLGPLGRGFRLDGARPSSTLLVACGLGLTALVGVPAALGGRPRALLAFGTEEQAAAACLLGADTETSLAPRLVTAPLEAALAGGDVRLVLAAGPLDLARAVAARCATAGVACQAALEAPMACGFGACFGCVVPLDGTLRRLCVEGPVVDAVRLAAANGDGDAGAPAAAARSGAG